MMTDHYTFFFFQNEVKNNRAISVNMLQFLIE